MAHATACKPDRPNLYQAAPLLESLEERTLLAGNVSVQVLDHVLTVLGDVLNNDIVITPVGRMLNAYQVGSGSQYPTRINGHIKPQNFTGVRNGIFVDFDDGQDRLKMQNCLIKGKLVVDGDLGDDTINLKHVSATGRGDFRRGDHFLLEDLTVGGNLVFTQCGGAGPASILAAGGEVGGSLLVTTVGYDSYGVYLSGFTVAGTTAIYTTPAKDYINLDDSTFQGNVDILTGAGNDELYVDANYYLTDTPTTFNGHLTVRLGYGNDYMVVGIKDASQCLTVFNGQTIFYGGPDSDTRKLQHYTSTSTVQWTEFEA